MRDNIYANIYSTLSFSQPPVRVRHRSSRVNRIMKEPQWKRTLCILYNLQSSNKRRTNSSQNAVFNQLKAPSEFLKCQSYNSKFFDISEVNRIVTIFSNDGVCHLSRKRDTVYAWLRMCMIHFYMVVLMNKLGVNNHGLRFLLLDLLSVRKCIWNTVTIPSQ
jgi:hypothetical protein